MEGICTCDRLLARLLAHAGEQVHVRNVCLRVVLRVGDGSVQVVRVDELDDLAMQCNGGRDWRDAPRGGKDHAKDRDTPTQRRDRRAKAGRLLLLLRPLTCVSTAWLPAAMPSIVSRLPMISTRLASSRSIAWAPKAVTRVARFFLASGRDIASTAGFSGLRRKREISCGARGMVQVGSCLALQAAHLTFQ